jgi:hypothetical protein
VSLWITGAEEQAMYEGARALEAQADLLATTAPTLAHEMLANARVLRAMQRKATVRPARELAPASSR